jgi:hypothetical protein
VGSALFHASKTAMPIKLQKRGCDFFISYGHADLTRVTELVSWLKKACGLAIWFDAESGNAAQRSSELLGNAIGNSRGVLFLLSEGWKKSTWCKNEYEVALVEQRAQEGFEVVAARLDDVDVPSWFNVAEIIDLRRFEPRACVRLLCSLASDVPHRFDNCQDIYLASPWSRRTAATQIAIDALKNTGWRLVGDSPNLTHLGPQRIEAIMATTRGVVAVLPAYPQEKYGTSPFIIEEAELALKCGKPLLILAEPGVAPSTSVVQASFRGAPVEISDAKLQSNLVEALNAFDQYIENRPHTDSYAYIFLATSLRRDAENTDDVSVVIERASNMRCVRGERLFGVNVQNAIVDHIRRAALMIADVTDDHRNTLIEAGIAMGCGTQLKLIVHAPGGEIPKKRFMFEGQELYPYRTEEEKLGLCYWIARQYRRRVYVAR